MSIDEETLSDQEADHNTKHRNQDSYGDRVETNNNYLDKCYHRNVYSWDDYSFHTDKTFYVEDVVKYQEDDHYHNKTNGVSVHSRYHDLDVNGNVVQSHKD